MKLLFDENLSPALPRALAENYPSSVHVHDAGLKGADDIVIWRYAAEHGFLLVTKDDDFEEISVLRGAPPKLIMLRIGNCRTTQVIELLRSKFSSMEGFDADQTASLLNLS